MNSEQEQIFLSRVTLYLNELANSQPNLKSRVMQERISKEVLKIAKELIK